MDNQHRKIKGYRELTQVEIDLMNEIKVKGIELGELCAKLKVIAVKQRLEARTDAEVRHLTDTESERWVAIGRTKLQEGLMALTRAVAQPEFF